ARDAGCAVELRVADLRRAWHLPIAGLASQLHHHLVDLPQTGGTDRLAVRDQPAVGVHGQPTADLERPRRPQGLLVAVCTEPVLRQVDDLGAGVGVLQLDDVDVLGPDAGLLERSPRGVGRGTGRLLDRKPRAVHFEGAEPPRPYRAGAQMD